MRKRDPGEKVIIAVTELEYKKGKTVFEHAEKDGFICVSVPCDESELASAISERHAKHVILGVEKYSGVLYESLPKGAVMARFGVGIDNIDQKLATEKGLFCTNTPDVLEKSVAELTVTMLLSAARHLIEHNENTHKGGWKLIPGTEIAGKQLAVIGCGTIGSHVARIVSAGFDMKVIGCEIRDVDVEALKRWYGYTNIVKDYAEAVANADFVSIHIPSSPATRNFINSCRLSLIPKKAWLINTARGAVVDERALYDALVSDGIRGAALDVFEYEPYIPFDKDRDLRTLPNVIMTPHISSSTVDACQRVSERALRNIALAERREFESMDLLNPEVLLT